ncbi:hypothetical protein ACM64Y_19395 [Novispirillum sp. DQ9]|uniref:hypothetical protein n=1 Tax=Novispirillum sp. DQ9 TaxID=3398612 RepID=UPI003C7A65B7
MPHTSRIQLDLPWGSKEVDIRHTFSNVRPSVAESQRKQARTRLESLRDVLEDIAATDAVGKAAKKAYKSEAGRLAIEDLTVMALSVQDDVAYFPSDREMKQRAYLLDLLKAIATLKDLIARDHPNTTDEDFWYSNALNEVLGTEISLRRLFHFNNEPSGLKGKLRPYGLEVLLASIEGPIRSRAESLLERPETTAHKGDEIRRIVYALYDALDKHDAKLLHPSKNALVTAFVTALRNPFPDHASALRAVTKIIAER